MHGFSPPFELFLFLDAQFVYELCCWLCLHALHLIADLLYTRILGVCSFNYTLDSIGGFLVLLFQMVFSIIFFIERLDFYWIIDGFFPFSVVIFLHYVIHFVVFLHTFIFYIESILFIYIFQLIILGNSPLMHVVMFLGNMFTSSWFMYNYILFE